MKIVFCLRLLAHLENNNNNGREGVKKATLDNNKRIELNCTELELKTVERNGVLGQ